jgi:DNA-binding NarL/FixJ family response regulator
MKNKLMRVALIQEDKLLRLYLEQTIEQLQGCSLDFSIDSISALENEIQLQDYNPDILLLEMVLDGYLDGGIRVIHLWKKKKRKLPNIVIVSQYCDHWMVQLMQQIGVAACVSKSILAIPNLLENLLKKVYQKEGFLTLSQNALVTPDKQEPLSHADLTTNQRTILNRLKQGQTQNEIAQQLSKTVSTVNNTVAQLKKKFKVKTITDLLTKL